MSISTVLYSVRPLTLGNSLRVTESKLLFVSRCEVHDMGGGL